MTRFITRTLVGLVAAAGACAMPANAKADPFRHEPGRVWVAPVFEDRCERIWIEPVYRTETVPVFVNGYFKTVCDRVAVEPIFEYRDVVKYHCGRRIVTRERVCVREGGWRTIERQEWVAPHYRHETRQVLVVAGHWETRTNRVCVREGFWRDIQCGPAPRHHSDRMSVSFGVRF